VTADIMLMQCVRVIGIKIMSLYVLDYWDTGVLFSHALLTETILWWNWRELVYFAFLLLLILWHSGSVALLGMWYYGCDGVRIQIRVLSDSVTFFANPKSDGFTDSFRFGFSFCFGKPTSIICHDTPSAIQK